MFVNLFTSLNCSGLQINYIPDAEENLNSLSALLIFLFVFCGLLVLLSIVLYVDFILFIFRKSTELTKHERAVWLLGIYPVSCTASFVALLVPRTSVMNLVVCSLYLSICVNKFVNMLINAYGGLNQMTSHLISFPISLNSPPFCCCCRCLPKLRTTRFRLRILQGMVLQYAITQPLFSYIAAVFYIDGGNITLATAGVKMPTTWLRLFNTFSTLIAIYAFMLIYRVSRVPLEGTSLVLKFTCVQLVIVFSNLQYSVLTALANFGIIPCNPPLTSIANAARIHYICLIIELSIIGIIAWLSYRWTALRHDNDESALITNVSRLRSEDQPFVDYGATSNNTQIVDKKFEEKAYEKRNNYQADNNFAPSSDEDGSLMNEPDA